MKKLILAAALISACGGGVKSTASTPASGATARPASSQLNLSISGTENGAIIVRNVQTSIDAASATAPAPASGERLDVVIELALAGASARSTTVRLSLPADRVRASGNLNVSIDPQRSIVQSGGGQPELVPQLSVSY